MGRDQADRERKMHHGHRRPGKPQCGSPIAWRLAGEHGLDSRFSILGGPVARGQSGAPLDGHGQRLGRQFTARGGNGAIPRDVNRRCGQDGMGRRLDGAGRCRRARSPDHNRRRVVRLAVQSAVGSRPDSSAMLVGAFARLATTAIAADGPTGFNAMQSSPASAPAFVASEQDVVQANRGKKAPMVSAVYPNGPTPVLDFPVVRITLPSADLNVAAAQTLFVSQLGTTAARMAYSEAGLRADPRLPLGAGENAIGAAQRPVTAASSPAAAQVAVASRLWVAAVKPSNLLAAIDVSGSMGSTTGTGLSKIALAAAAARTAMTIVPDSWTLGLWAFSAHDPPATDWTEIAPLANVGSSRAQLAAAAATLPGRVGGNTGLYDTAWAAYQDVTRNYNPADVNVVAILTDGANVDPNGIDLPTLTSRLKATYNPARPVRIVTIGIGAQADAGALRAISNATHGQSYIVLNPVDIKSVLLQSIVANN